MEEGILSTNGRIRRSTYLLRWVCIKIPYWIILMISMFCIYAFYFGMAFTEVDPGITIIAFAFFAIVYLILYIIQLALLLPQIIKRLHDMDKSGWLAIIVLLGWIPYIGWVFTLIFFLILVAVDGTIGENQYGEDPKQRIPYMKNETY